MSGSGVLDIGFRMKGERGMKRGIWLACLVALLASLLVGVDASMAKATMGLIRIEQIVWYDDGGILHYSEIYY